MSCGNSCHKETEPVKCCCGEQDRNENGFGAIIVVVIYILLAIIIGAWLF